MDSKLARDSALRRRLLGAAALGALAFAALVLALSLLWPRHDARELRVGDPASVVAEVLGEATAEYRSKPAIEASHLRSMNFVFGSLTDGSAPLCKTSGLPEVVGRALWFRRFTSSGTLVYLDASDRVTAVFSAGT